MLELILLISVFTQGLFIAGHSPYVLNGIRHKIATSLGGAYRERFDLHDNREVWYEFDGWINELWKPFWGCPTCMASFWGIIIYSCTQNYTLSSIYELPIVIIGASGVNFILFNNLIKKHL